MIRLTKHGAEQAGLVQPEGERMTKLDKIIFLTLIAASALAVLFTNVIFAGGAGETVVVEVDGKEYGRYELNRGKEAKILDVRTDFGYNRIVIEGGSVHVAEADCTDKLDVQAGAISSCGSMIVCLPNRLVVRIEGERDVDGVAY